ncbi:DUF397 domain-containing protein [Nonomuraea sp. 3N208]|uniref:DUF397 domain-containing protein n=1 Tax=Nonomuraea sp. 3N208 TaxID=3457421 RepID=UPI003FD20D4B
MRSRQWRRYTNGGGDCVDMTPVSLPPEHPKHGRGRAVALRDSEDPDGPVLIFTGSEDRSVWFFGRGIESGAFEDLI